MAIEFDKWFQTVDAPRVRYYGWRQVAISNANLQVWSVHLRATVQYKGLSMGQ